jgi:hypothetical protein
MFRNIFQKPCRLWDNVEKYGRAGLATDVSVIRLMNFAWWITRGIDTYLEYVVLIVFPRQQWFRIRASVLHLYLPCFLFLIRLSKINLSGMNSETVNPVNVYRGPLYWNLSRLWPKILLFCAETCTNWWHLYHCASMCVFVFGKFTEDTTENECEMSAFIM